MSTASIPIPFALGQEVWLADYDRSSQWEQCQVCFGQLKVKMTLGNNEEFMLDCAHCSPGHSKPSGKTYTHRTRFVPRRFTPESVSMSGSEFYYAEGNIKSAPAKLLSTDRSACEVMCDKMNAAEIANENGRTVANLISNKKSMAWSVGYWRNQLKRSEHEAERIRERLGIVIESKKAKP